MVKNTKAICLLRGLMIEILAWFNYILNSWGNEYGRIDKEIANHIEEKK